MNKLQLIMIMGVILTAGVTWQMASHQKLQAANENMSVDSSLSAVATEANQRNL